MLVPSAMIQLYESHTPFDEPSCEHTVRREAAWFAGVGTVHVEHRLRLATEVTQFRNCGLHAKCTLVLIDPGQCFRIARHLVPQLIKRSETIEHLPACGVRIARRIG